MNPVPPNVSEMRLVATECEDDADAADWVRETEPEEVTVPEEPDVVLPLETLDPALADENDVKVEFPETMVTALPDVADVIEIELSVTRLSGRDEAALAESVVEPLAVAEED